MFTDSGPISLSKCCPLQSLKHSLKFPLVRFVAGFFTQTFLFPPAFFFTSNPVFFNNHLLHPLSHSSLYHLPSSLANPCRCCRCPLALFSALWCSRGSGLTAELCLSSDRRQVVTTLLLFPILQVCQGLLLPGLVPVPQATEDVLGRTSRRSCLFSLTSNSNFRPALVCLPFSSETQR